MSKRRQQEEEAQTHQHNGRMGKKARARAARLRAEAASQQRAYERRRLQAYSAEMNRRLAKS